MGYLTKHSLSAFDADTLSEMPCAVEEEVTHKLYRLMGGSIDKRWRPDNFEHLLSDSMKWYRHEEHLDKISQKYPNYIFVLEGVGEEFPDAWRYFVQNGKGEKVYAEVHYPQPDNPTFAKLYF